MTTSRHAYRIDTENPGSEVAAETAAAMAAASIVFKESDPHYSQLLLRHAEQVYMYIVYIYIFFCHEVYNSAPKLKMQF
jgi:Glycosyl hydrolase family 9